MVLIDCPHCKGTGDFMDGSKLYPACKGTGLIDDNPPSLFERVTGSGRVTMPPKTAKEK